MKGYIIEKTTELAGIKDCLRTDAPEPVCGSNQVLVDIYATGLNFFDILMAADRYQNKPKKPYGLGVEFAGVVSANSPIPDGCDFVPGLTRVFGSGQGAYAEKIAADYWSLIEIPDNASFEQMSGGYITLPTSYAALKLRAKLQPDEWLLVHAGAGGVGIAALQLGKLMGAKTIATAGSAEKLEICKRVGGADYAINYKDKDWQAQIKKITDGRGVDVVYDPVGLIVPSMKVIAWNGRLLVIGFAGGAIEKAPLNLVLLKNISIVGLHWGAYLNNEADKIGEVWSELLEFISTGKLVPVVMDPVYEGLESLPQGLEDLQNRKTWGKAVVRVRPDPKFPPKSSKSSKL